MALEELKLSALAFTSCGVSISDATKPEMPLIFVNQAFVGMTGYTAEEILGLNCRFLQREDRDQPGLREVRAALRESRHGQAILRNYRRDGIPFWNELTLSPILDLQGQVTHFVGVQTDVTAREEAERERARLFSELRQANRRLDDFAHIVSHDLRAPLRAIQGFAEALLEDHGAELDETGRDYATRIVAAGNRMERLIQDLLAYSRMSQGEVDLRVVDLEGVMDEAVSSLLDALRERGGQIAVERPLPAVLAHRPTLTQAVINLLANAVTFVEPGESPRVRVWGEKLDGRLRLWVADNGIGVAPEHQERIFGVFERLHGTEEYPGTGVGLAIVRKGVERMGGKVGVESRRGEGSRFWIELRRPKESLSEGTP